MSGLSGILTAWIVPTFPPVSFVWRKRLFSPVHNRRRGGCWRKWFPPTSTPTTSSTRFRRTARIAASCWSSKRWLGFSNCAGSQRRAASRARRSPSFAPGPLSLKVLVVIAFHQPITRPEIEAVRGVSLSQATMELLLETRLITAHGRKEAPGTPTLWVTTALFLAQFGLKSLRDLPGLRCDAGVFSARKRDAPTRPAKGAEPADGEAAEQPPADQAPD